LFFFFFELKSAFLQNIESIKDSGLLSLWRTTQS
jgi:hypothetical protein